MKASVLITGASGFIGSELYKSLENDYSITAISTSNKEKFVHLNLLDREACKIFFEDKQFDVVIHAAAIAHGKNKISKLPLDKANIEITKNVFDFIDTQNSIVLYLSSVSVYSYLNSIGIISAKDNPIPISRYGISKLYCENYLRNLKTKSLHIFRLAPVYSDSNLKDLKKRIFLPFFRIPFLTQQERKYSFCHINQITKIINEFIDKDISSLQILKDENDLSQIDLLKKINTNIMVLKINTNLLGPLFYLLDKMPFSKSKMVRDMLHKLFFSVVYTNN